MKTVCIVCKKELDKKNLKDAKAVKEDKVIKTIRALKKALKIATNAQLYVCKEHVAEQQKRRKEFEKSIVITGLLAALVFIGLAAVPILAKGQLNIGSIFAGLLIAVLLVLLGGFLKYTPQIKV